MTETSPMSTQCLPNQTVEQRSNTVGVVHPHVEIKIVDPVDGSIVDLGQPGELCVRGYSVMLGYWNNPDATNSAIDEEGWMHSGDLAQIREDGCVCIVGRIKDMVIRAGENIYPREIEEFLHKLPHKRFPRGHVRLGHPNPRGESGVDQEDALHRKGAQVAECGPRPNEAGLFEAVGDRH